MAALFNAWKCYLSANHGYGSGIQIIREAFRNQPSRLSYKRVYTAITCNFKLKNLTDETGLSIQKVFDTKNLVHRNFKNININKELVSVKIDTDAIPFTPVLFLKVVF